MKKIKHSEYIDTFLQYLWSDLLENQDLSRELIDILNEAGSKLEKAKKKLIEDEPKNDGIVIQNEILRMINPAPDPVKTRDKRSDYIAEFDRKYEYQRMRPEGLGCSNCNHHTKDCDTEELKAINNPEIKFVKCLKASDEFGATIYAIADGACKLFEPLTKTLDEWATIHNIKIIDPDGFDRSDPDLFKRQFSYSEFQKGILNCTVEGVNNHGN